MTNSTQSPVDMMPRNLDELLTEAGDALLDRDYELLERLRLFLATCKFPELQSFGLPNDRYETIAELLTTMTAAAYDLDKQFCTEI